MLERLSVTNDNLVETGRAIPPAGTAPGYTGTDALALLGQLPGLLCVIEGGEGTVTFANDALRRLTGRELSGRAFGETPMAAWTGLRDRLRLTLSTRQRSELRVTLPPPSATVIDFVVQPILADDGSLSAIALQGQDVTAQVRQEASLQAVHERAESILDVLGDGFVAFDNDFRVVKINAAALKYDGRDESEILGKTHWEAWPTSKGSFLEGVYRRCRDEQEQISVERRYLGFGKDRWLELRLCPVPGGIVSFYRDVTDRKVSEAALRASEERFRALVEAVPHLVWEAGTDGRIEWFNGRFADYTGLTIDELQNGVWRQVLHPDDYDSIATAWRSAQLSGAVFEGEFRLRRKIDDTYRWFLAKGVPVRNAEGDVVRWIGTNTEIHDAKAAASDLEQRNSRLEERVAESSRDRERMWQLSTDLMLVASVDGDVLAANPAWKLVLGWSDAELQGTSFLDLIHPEERQAIAERVVQRTIGESGCLDPVRLRHKNGEYRWIAWRAVPGNDLIHAVGRDITAEQVAADALRQTEEALRQSQKMEAVGQLTGGIAHDFNNLLTGVIGSLDLLESRIAQGRVGEAGRYIEAATSSARRAASLTHRLLAFSRRQPLDPRPVNANELVGSMDELFRRTVSEAFRVSFVSGDDLWLTSCDPNQLESALLNLVINARDAMSEGGTIVIRSENAVVDEDHRTAGRELAAGEYVAISVHDTGTGMPQDVSNRAFEPFFTTKPIGQGTGLGLSMVYGFVRQSGGHVAIASEPGRGTIVTVYLPRYRGDAAEAHRALVPIETGHARAGEVVLVVEDEPVVRQLVIDMLDERGYRLLEAEDGPSALAILQSGEKVDLLLTDVGLPGLNGRQLADAARVLRPDINILFMTGYVDNKILQNGFLGPRMEVIAKPFAGDALAAKVEHMIHD